MSKQSEHPQPSADVRDLDAPEAESDAVRGGFLGGLVTRVAPVVRTVAPLATPSVPIPPPAE